METQAVFTVTNHYDELERISSEVADFCGRHDQLATMEHRLLLVLEELLSNTIDYGYDTDDTAPHEIGIRLSLTNDSLHVVYEDDARPFDPTMADQADVTGTVEERPVGGLGIHLVVTIMRSVTYKRIDNRNRLSMRMALPE